MLVCLNEDGISCLNMQQAMLEIWLLDFKVFE